MTGTFTGQQVDLLLRPLNPSRVEQRKQAGMTLSYISQADMRAHAIRLFGFGGFDIETLDTRLMFEDQNEQKRWNVGYLVTVQVTIRNPDGEQVCRYSESAVGQSTQPQRGEAHDMALKSATSDAMKRCFINIGDQGGLGLYNNGSTAPFIKDTIIRPSGQTLATSDEQTEEQA
jgi:recombination DNA repair RAD52 pathway protein